MGNGLGQVEVLDLQTRRFSGAVKGLSGEAAAKGVRESEGAGGWAGGGQVCRGFSHFTAVFRACAVHLVAYPAGSAGN